MWMSDRKSLKNQTTLSTCSTSVSSVYRLDIIYIWAEAFPDYPQECIDIAQKTTSTDEYSRQKGRIIRMRGIRGPSHRVTSDGEANQNHQLLAALQQALSSSYQRTRCPRLNITFLFSIIGARQIRVSGYINQFPVRKILSCLRLTTFATYRKRSHSPYASERSTKNRTTCGSRPFISQATEAWQFPFISNAFMK